MTAESKPQKFRKKPVVIEAVQWLLERKPTDYPDWLWNRLAANPELFDSATGRLTIRTLEGDMICQPGDWVIQGVKLEVYPCKPDIFAATYELVDDGALPEESRPRK